MLLRLFLVIGMLVGLLQTVDAQTVQKFTSAPGAPISEAAAARDTIVVGAGGTVTDLKVEVNISHSHSGDLRIRLTHQQSGRSVILLRWLNGPGYAFGCGSNGINAVFDDAAAGPMDAYDCSNAFDAIVTGSWKPTQGLSAFEGVPISGSWMLEVSDAVQSDNGTLNSWALVFNDTMPPPPPPPGFNPALVNGPPTPLCTDFNGAREGAPLIANVPDDVYGLYCRVIAEDGLFLRAAGAIGNQEIIDQGIIHAVDVYSPNGGGTNNVTICLRGTGQLVYLNAADSPRVPQYIDGMFVNGYTCMALPNVGMVVMIGDPTQLPEIGTDASLARTAGALSDCRVITRDRLRLRTAPHTGGEVMTVLVPDMTLTAVSYQAGWFEVLYMGGRGWLSGAFLTLDGQCFR